MYNRKTQSWPDLGSSSVLKNRILVYGPGQPSSCLYISYQNEIRYPAIRLMFGNILIQYSMLTDVVLFIKQIFVIAVEFAININILKYCTALGESLMRWIFVKAPPLWAMNFPILLWALTKSLLKLLLYDLLVTPELPSQFSW